MAGMTPAVTWALLNAAQGKDLNDASLLDTPPTVAAGPLTRDQLLAYAPKQAAAQLLKQALYPYDEPADESDAAGPLIDTHEVVRTVYHDPDVTGALGPVLQAGTAGLVTGAARLVDRLQPPRYIGWDDIGRMTLGMGTGFVTGALVGKALGALFNAPAAAQDTLKATGAFAGVLKELVPIAFGSRSP